VSAPSTDSRPYPSVLGELASALEGGCEAMSANKNADCFAMTTDCKAMLAKFESTAAT
jgi:hypothetical protein